MDTMHAVAAFAAGTAFGIGATQAFTASTRARVVGGAIAVVALAFGAVTTVGLPRRATAPRQVVSIDVPSLNPRTDIPAPRRPTASTPVKRSDR